MTHQRWIYSGPLRAGVQCVPARQVPFTRGVPVAFTPDEARSLNQADWSRQLVTTPLTAGTVAEVLDRVKADPSTVHEVLAAEQAGKARYTLLAALNELADQATNPKET